MARHRSAENRSGRRTRPGRTTPTRTPGGSVFANRRPGDGRPASRGIRQVAGPQFAGEGVAEEEDSGVSRPFRSSGSSARVSRNGPRRLTAKTSSHAAGETSMTGVRGKDGGVVDHQIQAARTSGPAGPRTARTSTAGTGREGRRSAPISAASARPAPEEDRYVRTTKYPPSQGHGRSSPRSAGCRR